MNADSKIEKVLSVRQPWAWLIIHAGKDVENRTWPTNFLGRVLIHASKTMTTEEYRQCCRFLSTDSRLEEAFQKLPERWQLQFGGIIGEVEVVGCVPESESPWFVGEYGFLLQNAKPLPFQPCRGALGFFDLRPSAQSAVNPVSALPPNQPKTES